MDALKEYFGPNVEVIDDDGHLTVNFGEIANRKVKDLQDKIESGFKLHCSNGTVTIITTEGKLKSLLTALFFPSFKETAQLVFEYM